MMMMMMIVCVCGGGACLCVCRPGGGEKGERVRKGDDGISGRGKKKVPYKRVSDSGNI